MTGGSPGGSTGDPLEPEVVFVSLWWIWGLSWEPLWGEFGDFSELCGVCVVSKWEVRLWTSVWAF